MKENSQSTLEDALKATNLIVPMSEEMIEVLDKQTDILDKRN